MPDDFDYSQPKTDSEEAPGTPVLTWLVCALCVLVTLASYTIKSPDGSLWFRIGTFGAIQAETIWSGHYAGLLSCVFLHGSIVHIAFNMLWLWQLGAFLEDALNPLLWLAFFVSSSVVAAGAQLAFSNQTGIGVSGVVYAMFGLMWAGREKYPNWGLIATRQNWNIFLIWGVACFVMTRLKIANIANAAHFGGLFFGLAVGWLFIDRSRRLLSTTILVGLIGMTILSATLMPWSASWRKWKALSSREPVIVSPILNNRAQP